MSDQSSGNRQFMTTHWSVVLAVADKDENTAQQALSELCQVYWYPIYAFIRRQGVASHEAADFTQEFFSSVLERRDFENVDPSRGKFRSFLLAAIKNFLNNQWDRKKAQKRGGHLQFIPLDYESADKRYSNEPDHSETAETLFEKRWAESILEQVQNQLAAEFAKSKKAEQFDRLKMFLAGPAKDTSYADVAKELDMSEVAVKVAVHRMKQRFGQILRAEISQTVQNENEVEEEIGHLFEVLHG